MTVGFWSPLPPARSGVADHAAELLPVLRRNGDVRVSPSRCDVALYHIGNNHLHARIYDRALREPGVVVLHDAVLHHFALGHFTREAYIEEFVYNYGEWSRATAERLWDGRARSATDPEYFAYPMLRRLAESSRAVVVHNPAAARMVLEHCATARVWEIPLLSRNRESSQTHEIVGCRCFSGVFGHLRESKRVPTVLRACRRAGVSVLVAGPAEAEYERSIAALLRQANAHRVGYLPEADFRAVLESVDVCVNLRQPSAGETSAITVAAMAAGRAVILTDSEENRRYPDGACVRVSAGIREEPELEAMLRWLSASRSDLRAIGGRAAAHIAAEHSPDRVAALYSTVLRTA